MSETLEVGTLSDEERSEIEQELSQLYGVPPTEPDHSNAAINSLFRNFSESGDIDRRGNPVIDYEEYLQLLDQGHRIDEPPYQLRFHHPSGGIKLGPAAKYQKYYGEGYRPVLRHELKPQDESRPTNSKIVKRDEIEIFFCNEKYSGCPRFFDSERGRGNHWRSDHEGAWGTNPRVRKNRRKQSVPETEGKDAEL